MRRIIPYAYIAAGALVAAFGINGFLVSHGLADGGLTGLALLIFYLWGIPVGLTYFLLNIPLVAWLWRLYGFEAIIRTAWGALMLSISLPIMKGVAVPTTNTLLGAIYGGVLLGTGMGVIFRAGGTTGGADIIARIISHLKGLEMGKTLLAIDVLVIGLVGVVLGHEIALYSLIAMFAATRLIDAIQEGLVTFKSLTIISTQAAAIRQAIIDELERGVTVFSGRGGYTGEPREILYCVVGRSEVGRAKAIAHRLDSDAFVVVSEAREVLGKGFMAQGLR